MSDANRPSDSLKQTQLYADEPMLQTLMARYEHWTPELWSPAVSSFDIGYLMGLIVRLQQDRDDLDEAVTEACKDRDYYETKMREAEARLAQLQADQPRASL